jgi:F-type H+-transporting ATPase subunit a
MKENSPFHADILFRVGQIPVARCVVTTTAIVVILSVVAWGTTRRLRLRPGRRQAALEAVVTVLGEQANAVLHRDSRPFLPLLGTLFLFILVANLSGLVPGVRAPTASLETPAALALVVLFSSHAYGVRERGFKRYLASYLDPNPLMLPLNILSQVTRTFSLMVRLFGNIMSHELVLGVVAAIAGLLVPLPFMALGILIGVVQAYIFSILATVFIGAAVGASEEVHPT